MTRNYATVSGEIAQAIERLTAAQLSVAAIQQDLTKLLQERAALEAELGLATARRTNRSGSVKRLTREEAAKVRRFWKENAVSLNVPFRTAGIIPAKVRAAFAAKK